MSIEKKGDSHIEISARTDDEEKERTRETNSSKHIFTIVSIKCYSLPYTKQELERKRELTINKNEISAELATSSFCIRCDPVVGVCVRFSVQSN